MGQVVGSQWCLPQQSQGLIHFRAGGESRGSCEGLRTHKAAGVVTVVTVARPAPTVRKSYKARPGDQIFFSLLLCWLLFAYLFVHFGGHGPET